MPDGRPAVFLDRDGTVVHDPGFLHRPDDVRLLPGAGAAVARLNSAGYVVVSVSNQSGIGRGMYAAADYDAVQQRVAALLAEHGARFDASYFCPHYPLRDGPCDCRKPGTRLFEDARAALGLDFATSWWVGDRASDVAPARALGGKGILVLTGEGARQRALARAVGAPAAHDLASAVRAIVPPP
jgi:D-glycero-D-manno-heptose 1,7-bisphosphate phosphatase